MVDNKLTMRQPGSFVAKSTNSVLRCTRRSVVSRSMEMDHIPLLSTGETAYGVLLLFWVPQYKKDMELLLH